MNKRELQRVQNKLYTSIRNMLDIVTYLKDLFEGKNVDKKMHQVTKRMKTAVKDIKKDEPKKAEKVLKKAEKKNEKLVKIDRDVRDPMIKKCKKMMKAKAK